MEEFKKREKTTLLSIGLILSGLLLWYNHYMYWGTLDFFDTFPSHESTGLILILGGFGIIFTKMFNYKYPVWLQEKNSNKINKVKSWFKKQ